jgi:hypothetical protein
MAPSLGQARHRTVARGGAILLLLGALATPARSSPVDAPPPTTFTVLGRVVDESRARVAGAVVTVQRGGIDAPPSEGTTDARGRFRFEIPVDDLLTASDDSWGVTVRHGGRVGAGRTASSVHGVGFAGTIVVRPGLDVPVRIAERRAGVRVRAWTGPITSPAYAEAETDAEGRAVLRNLPRIRIEIQADELSAGVDLTESAAPVPQVNLARRPRVPVVVGVTGVPPEARQRTWVEVRDRRGWRSVERIPLARAVEGTLDVPAGADLRAVTEYPSPPRATSPWIDVPAGDRVWRIDLDVEQPRPLRWPVNAGSAPVPPDGTVLRVLRLANSDYRAFPSSARIERGQIVVDAVGPEPEIVWAFAPDGSAARLVTSPYGRGPLPTEFRRQRTIDVRLRESDGRPVVGALVREWYESTLRAPILLRPTDAEGRTRVVLLHDEGIGLALAEGAWSWRPLAAVEPGVDATLDLTLPPKVPVALRLLLDGQPGIPAEYHLSCLAQDVEEAEEDVQRGEIRFEARPSAEGTMEIFFGAPGFTPEDGPGIGGLRRTVAPGVPLTLRLRRLAMLRVRLSATSAAEGDGREVILESAQGDAWRPMARKPWDERLYVSADSGLLVPIDRGTWRVRDPKTGRTTEPVVIGTPAPEQVVERTLDVGR